MRAGPPAAGGETATLLGSLDRQRAIFFWKCAELERPDCRPRLGASTLTLGGLLKHLSIVPAAAT